MYGEGIQFAKEPCKTCQYTGRQEHHLLLAHVVLVDPNNLTSSCTGRLPELRDLANASRGRFDSNVVDPSVSFQNQAHHEYIVFRDEQACPELLITYEMN